MTTIAVIGADGMLGRKLSARLIAESSPGTHLVLSDIRPPAVPDSGPKVTSLVGDMSDPAIAAELISHSPDVIFHVAATFMGQADSDFFAGYRINFFTVQVLLEAIRRSRPGRPPRFVHASSIGVYGPPFPALISDDHPALPDSSYGTQKLMCEALVNDYSRLGFIDGVALRLPTLAIRPGAVTHGNSGFFSNIIREPLAGRRALLPASPDVRHWIASPRSAVEFLLHAAAIDTAPLGRNRSLVMPGLSVSVAEELEALRAVAGEAAMRLIDHDSPPTFRPEHFPAAFEAARAAGLGFRPLERDFAAIVALYQADQ